MKLLFDENLSGRLVEALADVFPESEQALAAGLGGRGDLEVWEYAKLHGFTLVSKDSDFYARSLRVGAPPKVVWVRLGNCSTAEVETLLRSAQEAVRAFLEEDAETCLQLKFPVSR